MKIGLCYACRVTRTMTQVADNVQGPEEFKAALKHGIVSGHFDLDRHGIHVPDAGIHFRDCLVINDGLTGNTFKNCFFEWVRFKGIAFDSCVFDNCIIDPKTTFFENCSLENIEWADTEKRPQLINED